MLMRREGGSLIFKFDTFMGRFPGDDATRMSVKGLNNL